MNEEMMEQAVLPSLADATALELAEAARDVLESKKATNVSVICVAGRSDITDDLVLATGGSAVDAISMIKKRGGKKIKFVCIIAAPDGLKKLHEVHPDVQVYVGHLDRCLNEDAYICPGLGDAGDRVFGTK